MTYMYAHNGLGPGELTKLDNIIEIVIAPLLKLNFEIIINKNKQVI